MCAVELCILTTVEETSDAMKIALRVLTAFIEERPPDPSDVEELRQLVPGGRPALDELACDVIQRAIRHRKEVQAEAVGAGG